MITLEQLLSSRDERAARQMQLLRSYPSCTLLCLTVQLPGAEKRNNLSLAIAHAGVDVLREIFSPMYEEIRDLETGYEAYFILPLDAESVKRLSCSIEDGHPLGRLMDMDVITLTRVVDRESLGFPPRGCLLCERPARYCIRARTHTTEELIDKIDKMVKEYLNSRKT